MEREQMPRQRLTQTGNSGDAAGDDLDAARERILGGLDAADEMLDSIDAVSAEQTLQYNRQHSAE